MRAQRMIERVMKNPGPLAQLAVKLAPHDNNMPPNFFLSEEDNIILNGKIDWLEYVPESDSIRVIDSAEPLRNLLLHPARPQVAVLLNNRAQHIGTWIIQIRPLIWLCLKSTARVSVFWRWRGKSKRRGRLIVLLVLAEPEDVLPVSRTKGFSRAKPSSSALEDTTRSCMHSLCS